MKNWNQKQTKFIGTILATACGIAAAFTATLAATPSALGVGVRVAMEQFCTLRLENLW
ncbi:hypothetical protein [Scytonema sp. PCC 10023]|uniref:hypothetical protein n=1 Tax=Scytonema sp. PCC 10023 TaxID=1680591 RepID=UPI0039C68E26